MHQGAVEIVRSKFALKPRVFYLKIQSYRLCRCQHLKNGVDIDSDTVISVFFTLGIFALLSCEGTTTDGFSTKLVLVDCSFIRLFQSLSFHGSVSVYQNVQGTTTSTRSMGTVAGVVKTKSHARLTDSQPRFCLHSWVWVALKICEIVHTLVFNGGRECLD